MGGIGIEEAAAIGADLLDRLLARHRSDDQGLVRPLQRGDVDVLGEGLGHALDRQHHRHHHGQGQEHVEADPHHVPPEVAEPLAPVGGEGPGQRADNGDAGGPGQEVLYGQADHLREVRHGRLAGIGLPVGVGDEADRGVERQVRRQPRQLQRIERQHPLQHQHRIEQDKARDVEGQQGRGVAEPGLRGRGLRPGQGQDRPLHRSQERVQGRGSALQHAGQMDAERPGDGHGEDERQGDFRPALPCHGIRSASEAFRTQQRPEHVDRDAQRRGGIEDVQDHLRAASGWPHRGRTGRRPRPPQQDRQAPCGLSRLMGEL